MNHVFWNTGAVLEAVGKKKKKRILTTVPILAIAINLVRNVLDPSFLKLCHFCSWVEVYVGKENG